MRHFWAVAVLTAILLGLVAAQPTLVAAAGESAPSFNLPRADGGTLALPSLKGKVVVLNFFGTFCPWCIKEVPELNQIMQTYGPQGVQVVGMGMDSLDGLKKFVASYHARYPVVAVSPEVRHAYGNLPGAGGLRGVPVTIIVNQAGIVSQVFPGYTGKAEIERQVRALLAAKP